MPKRLKLGKKYRDDVSGFEGVATAEYTFLNGCIRYQLTGESRDGKAPEELVFDIEQLSPVSIRTPAKPKGKRSGGGGIREVVGR
jgi:hypothetical protein